VKSLDELKKIKEETLASMRIREEEPTVRVAVGMSTCGIAAGARDTLNALMEEINKRNLSGVTVITTGCAGMCQREPLVDITEKDGSTYSYQNITPEKAKVLVSQHLVNKKPVFEWVLATRGLCREGAAERSGD